MVALAALVLAPIASAASSRQELPALSHEGAFATPCGVATDSHGDLYVNYSAGATKTAGKVYSPTGTLLTEYVITTSAIGCSTAVDSSGDIYTTAPTVTGGQLNKFVPSQYPPVAGTTYSPDTSINQSGRIIFGPPGVNVVNNVAIDPANQHLYVTEAAGNETQEYVTPAESYKLKCKGIETATLGPSSTTEEIKQALEAASPGPECTTVTVEEVKSINLIAVGRRRLIFSGALAQTAVPPVEVVKAGGNETAAEMFRGSNAPHISVYETNGTRVGGLINPGISGASYFGIDVYGTNGDIYVADKGNTKIYILNPTGTAIEKTITGPEGAPGCKAGSFGAMEKPSLAVDQSNGDILVSDIKTNGVVDEFAASGTCLTTIEHSPAFVESAPSDIAVDNSGTSTNDNAYITSGKTGGSVFAYGPLTANPEFKLTVTKEGTAAATGTVEGGSAARPNTINCGTGTGCEHEYVSGEEVLLKEVEHGSTFAGWTGCTSEPSATECKVTMSAAKNVKATFNVTPPSEFKLTVTKEGTGTGTVTGGSPARPNTINCGTGTGCEHEYVSGEEVTLTETPGGPSTFAGWTGCTSEPSPSECKLTMSAAKNVKATFNEPVSNPSTLHVFKSGGGAGTVTSSPAGINCGTEPCEAIFEEGETITLEAGASLGSTFAGWLGCSPVSGEVTKCHVTLDSLSVDVTAVFLTEGQQGAPGSPGAPGSNGKNIVVTAGAPGCGAAGGVTVEVEGEPSTKKEICNGAAGATGATGATGANGSNGSNGKNIVVTEITTAGLEGHCVGVGGTRVEVEGETSTRKYICNGEKGATGSAGSAGAKGEKGESGTQGATGLTGLTGSQGIPGAPGTNGAQGPVGTAGAQGPQGARGPAGPNGTVTCKVMQQKSGKAKVTCTVKYQSASASDSGARWQLEKAGRVVRRGRVDQGHSKLNLGHLAAGRYRLHIHGQKGSRLIVVG
jgi:hypothetical protein